MSKFWKSGQEPDSSAVGRRIGAGPIVIDGGSTLDESPDFQGLDGGQLSGSGQPAVFDCGEIE